jgi:hypothetical protein
MYLLLGDLNDLLGMVFLMDLSVLIIFFLTILSLC